MAPGGPCTRLAAPAVLGPASVAQCPALPVGALRQRALQRPQVLGAPQQPRVQEAPHQPQPVLEAKQPRVQLAHPGASGAPGALPLPAAAAAAAAAAPAAQAAPAAGAAAARAAGPPSSQVELGSGAGAAGAARGALVVLECFLGRGAKQEVKVPRPTKGAKCKRQRPRRVPEAVCCAVSPEQEWRKAECP